MTDSELETLLRENAEMEAHWNSRLEDRELRELVVQIFEQENEYGLMFYEGTGKWSEIRDRLAEIVGYEWSFSENGWVKRDK